MQKVQVNAEVDIKSMLSQLDTQALEAFMREIKGVLTQRKTKDAKAEEKALLLRLNEECSLPIEHWQRFKQLDEKKNDGSLASEEWDEFFQLIKIEEKLRLHRIFILGKLAQLKGLTLPEITEKLGIKAPEHAE